MAEALGITGSIVSILDLTGKIVRYANDVRGASGEIRDLIRELQQVMEVIGELKDRVKVESMTKGQKAILPRLIVELEKQLDGIGEILGMEYADPSGSSVNGTAPTIAGSAFLRTVTWPLRKEDIAVKIATIGRLETKIMTAFLGSIS